jgi:hypothetical protein
LAFSDIVKKSLTPIIYINVAGMAFGALSLIWMGYFGNAWPGFVGLFASPLVFPFLLLPAGILTGLMAITMKSHPKLEKVLTVISVLYIVTLLSLYTITAFYFLVGTPTIPAAIYAVCSAVLPWAIFAAKDRQNIFFTGLVLMMQLSAIVLVGLNVALRLTDFTQKFWIIWGTMMFCVCVEALYEKIMLDRKKPEETKPAS